MMEYLLDYDGNIRYAHDNYCIRTESDLIIETMSRKKITIVSTYTLFERLMDYNLK